MPSDISSERLSARIITRNPMGLQFVEEEKGCIDVSGGGVLNERVVANDRT